jgi:putative endonuclease
MRDTGSLWETAALRELERGGLKLLARNWNCRYGELDLVMRDADDIVFVEVRYRIDAGHGDGQDSVGTAKRAKLVRAAKSFLASHPALARLPCRFDVVAFSGTPGSGRCDWQRNAFDAY